MNLSTNQRPRELAGLFQSALDDRDVERWVIEPQLLARSIFVAAWCVPTLLDEVERELVRLHRTELAFLLREAASLRMQAVDVAGSRSLEAWRASFRETLRCALIDGVRVSPELFSLLCRCRAADLSCWPDAVELAGAALALHEVEPGRTRLGHALLAAGRVRDACAAFAVAFVRAARASDRQAALAGLAAARSVWTACEFGEASAKLG